MRNKVSKKQQIWRILLMAVLSVCFSLSPAFLLEPHAAEVPAFFTADSIMQEGIEDRNFAEAVYESISDQISRDNYILDDSWDTRDILINYGKETPVSYLAVINAQSRGIKSIAGIKLLKNTGSIILGSNDIHDLTPLKRNFDDPEDKLYFNRTQISINGTNFLNIVPSELAGLLSGSINVYSTLQFEETAVSYLYQDNTVKTINLDFGLELDGEKGGCFNQENSDLSSVNEIGASWLTYADYVNRYTGTTITVPQNDGSLVIAADANENKDFSFRPTAHYWVAENGENAEEKINLDWNYPFRTKFYRTLKQSFVPVIYSGVKLTKKDPEGKLLPGAKYILWRIDSEWNQTQYPDDSTVFTTDANGELIIPDLPSGDYILEEIEAPEGYDLDQAALTFTVRNNTAGRISSSVIGGDAEAEITSDGAEFSPVWDSVEEADDNGARVRKHYMQMAEGSVTTVTASSLGADALISNQGPELSLLKGEVTDSAAVTLLPEKSQIKVYAGAALLGTYTDPAEARELINNMIRTGSFDSSTGNISVTAVIAYREAENEYQELVHINKKEPDPEPDPGTIPEPEPPVVPAETVSGITVKKTWSEEEHPAQAFFQLCVKMRDGTVRLVGKGKTLSGANGWEACWSYKEIRTGIRDKASPSDASSSYASPSDAAPFNASPSNASEENAELYDEDGFLLDGMVMDDLEEGLYVEEVQIPDGWEPSYSAPRVIADGTILCEVSNIKIPEEPEKKPVKEPEDEPDEDTPVRQSGSSGGGGSGGGRAPEETLPAVPEPVVPEENLPVQEVLGANRKVIKRQNGLPYGRIASQKLPAMGEEPEEGGEKAGLYLVIILLTAFLVLGYRNRTAGREVTEHGKG